MSDDPRTQLAELFRWTGVACRALGSTLWGEICARMADDALAAGPTWDLLHPYAASSRGSAYPLRVLGGAHRMALDGSAVELASHLPSTDGDGDAEGTWAALRALLSESPSAILDALDRPPQTNEVGRSASLIGGFLVVAAETGLPLRALEIGASAGLNLRFDHYRYEQDDAGFGPISAPVRFAGLWRGGVPPFDAPLQVEERRGCDLDPVDVTTPDGRLTLLSYVWPDQGERFARTDAAIGVARRVPASVDRADAVDWLGRELEPREGRAAVVFHSIMWQYLPDPVRSGVHDVVEAAGARASASAPVAWLRLEPEDDIAFPELRLTTWPGGEERLLANCSFHLGPVEWLEPSTRRGG